MYCIIVYNKYRCASLQLLQFIISNVFWRTLLVIHDTTASTDMLIILPQIYMPLYALSHYSGLNVACTLFKILLNQICSSSHTHFTFNKLKATDKPFTIMRFCAYKCKHKQTLPFISLHLSAPAAPSRLRVANYDFNLTHRRMTAFLIRSALADDDVVGL